MISNAEVFREVDSFGFYFHESYVEPKIARNHHSTIIQSFKLLGDVPKKGIKIIGISVYQYSSSIRAYFREKGKAERNFKQFDFCNELSQNIFSKFNIQPTYQETEADYFSSSLLRIVNNIEILPHTDNPSRHFSNEWAIAHFKKYYSINLYLSNTSLNDGSVVIYDKKFTSTDKKFKSNNYGYSSKLFLNVSSTKITPKFGDLLIIDTSRYHMVCKSSQGPRITLSCFLGTNDHGMFCWA